MQTFKPIHLIALLVAASGGACSDSNFTAAKSNQPSQSSNATPAPAVTPSSEAVASESSTDGAGGGGAAPEVDFSANAAGSSGVTAAAPAAAPAPPAAPDPVIANIAGVSVLKVGVNFEDLRSGDADYNDAVLCFEGGFKVDATTVVSTAKQDVIGTTYSSSNCTHQITVVVVSPDGTKSKPFIYDSKTTAKVPMAFAIGDKLEVSMVSQGCDRGIVKSMHSAQDAKVLPDLCNNSK